MLLTADSHGMRNDVISLLQECDRASTVNYPSSLIEALRTTPLPEDLMLHTLIATYLPGTNKSLNLKGVELVRFIKNAK